VEFIWDDPSDPEGNVAHILSDHPDMKPEFIEELFTTWSGDENVFESTRNGIHFLVLEKTQQQKLYRIVFEKLGQQVKVKTAFRISKRKGGMQP
jgi:c-di-GMP-binding flagellar brake protein YcgR